MLSPFTTNDEVRAACGATEQELTDETLDLPLYEANLRLELGVVGTTLAADFEAVDIVGVEVRTSAQVNFHAAVQLFSPYAVTAQLEQSLPLLVAKSVTDGKAGMSRFSESPFKDALNAAKKNYERFRQNLQKKYAIYKSATAPIIVGVPTLFAIASPDGDPVIGT